MAFESDIQAQLKNPKQKRLLIVAGGLLVVGGIVFYVTMFGSPFGGAELSGGGDGLPGVVARSGNGVSVNENEIRRVKLDTAVLQSPMFRSLRTYSPDLPVTVGKLGNPNAFRNGSNLLPSADVPASTSTPATSTRTTAE
ncbi:MAG: hypothetical protein Q8Q39_05500 [bacterium]|nr:hypothetical protein [bacterium]